MGKLKNRPTWEALGDIPVTVAPAYHAAALMALQEILDSVDGDRWTRSPQAVMTAIAQRIQNDPHQWSILMRVLNPVDHANWLSQMRDIAERCTRE